VGRITPGEITHAECTRQEWGAEAHGGSRLCLHIKFGLAQHPEREACARISAAVTGGFGARFQRLSVPADIIGHG